MDTLITLKSSPSMECHGLSHNIKKLAIHGMPWAVSVFMTSKILPSMQQIFCFCLSSPALIQGEVVVARFLNWPPPDLENMSLEGVLLFGDGSQKMLAAITCWISMLLTWRHHGAEALQDKVVMGMMSSFLEVSTIIKAQDARGSQLESIVNRIVEQNVASKVQPVSSFAWSSILKTISGDKDRVRESTFEEALQQYNTHPMVVSYDRSETGMGAISLDGRKRQAVRNWVDKTSPEAYTEVLRSCHDLPFAMGPFGEAFAVTNAMFLRSTSGLDKDCTMAEHDGPLPSETFAEAPDFLILLIFLVLQFF